MKQINKVLNGIYSDASKTWKEEAKFHKKIEKEAIEGKRDFWILKNGFGSLSLYPEGHKTGIYVCHGNVENYKKKGYLKVLPKELVPKVIKIRNEVRKANKKYAMALKKIFDSQKHGEWIIKEETP